MATLRQVRNRIIGVKNTQKITKAMKMVAAAKLRRAQTAVLAARPYASSLREMLDHLLRGVESVPTDLVYPREVKTTGLVVVTSDRGLCGAFNTNLVRAAMQHIDSAYRGLNEQGRVKLICIGRKGHDLMVRRGYNIIEKHLGVYAQLQFPEAQRIAASLTARYRNGEFDQVEIFYNEFKSVSRQNIVVERFLPLSEEALGDASVGEAHAQPVRNYLYEPARETILESLIPKKLHFHIWRVLLESNAAEQGARMAAMDNATENANDLVQHLQLQYNKARQASITKELLEVVSGAEALKQEE